MSEAGHGPRAGLLRGWRRSGRIGLRTLAREWRAGEFKVLASALVVAVAAMVAVAAFTDRMDRGMAAGASELLAADLVVSTTEPLDASMQAEAARRGLATARTLDFRSVVAAGEALRLARVKAVSDAYPLRGVLRTAPRPYGDDAPTDAVPRPGTVWLEARLLGLLGVKVGDAIELGRLRVRIERVLTYEPDRGGDLFNIAPRVLMHIDDVPATGLVQPASRVRHRLLMAGPTAEVAAMRGWLERTRDPGQEVQGLRDARPEFRAALDRANRFLGLAATVSVLLAGVAIAVAARRHAQRHLDTAAMLRCLGLSQAGVIQVFTVQLGALGLAASLAGCALGYAAQLGLGELLGELLVADLPGAGPAPLAYGLATGLLCLLGFGLPPLLGLGKVPPLRVLRRDVGGASSSQTASYLAAAAALAALVLWQARDATLALYVLGGGAATMGALALMAWVLVLGLGRLRTRVGVAWRFGIANISRRAGASAVQIVAFGLGVMVLLLLGVVRGDLLEEWVESLPPDAPNFFLVNIQPEETGDLEAFLREEGIAFGALYPMVRGRLVAIDGAPVQPEDFEEPRAQRLAARDFNLSWSAALPPENRVVAGEFWPAGDAARSETAGPSRAISVEEGLARTLGMSLGDELTFLVAGERVSGTITSLREVDWDNFKVNFFVLFTPEGLSDRPATYISSFHVPAQRRPALVELVERFPSVTPIDVDALLGKVRELMERATLAVEYVFGFTLLAGFAVLFSATQATLDERRFEAAVVRTLGATRRRVLGALLAEFSLLGLLAGVLAALAASALGLVLAISVFDLPWHFSPWVWVVGLVGGTAGVTASGWLGTRQVTTQPPLVTLRDG